MGTGRYHLCACPSPLSGCVDAILWVEYQPVNVYLWVTVENSWMESQTCRLVCSWLIRPVLLTWLCHRPRTECACPQLRGATERRQHCRLSICSYFGWVLQILRIQNLRPADLSWWKLTNEAWRMLCLVVSFQSFCLHDFSSDSPSWLSAPGMWSLKLRLSINFVKKWYGKKLFSLGGAEKVLKLWKKDIWSWILKVLGSERFFKST